MDELNALYNKMSVYGDTYGDTVAPDVNALTGIETIPDPIEDPFILPISQGGGGDGGWTADTNYGTFEKEYLPDEDFGDYFSGVKGTPSMSGYVKQKQPGLAELFEALKKYSLTSNIMKMGRTGIETAQNWYADKKAKEKIQKEKDLMAEIQASNLAAAQKAAADKQAAKTAAGIGPTTGQGQAIASGDVRDIGGGFHEYRDSGTAASYEGSFKKGGRIRYGEGGIVTL